MEFSYQVTIRSRYKLVVRGRCLKCGCTDEDGCEPACAWIDADHTLCTACFPMHTGRLVRLLGFPPDKPASRPKGGR